MDIPVTTEIKKENSYFPFENPKMESDIKIKIEPDTEVKSKIEANIKIKIEPIKELIRAWR